MDGLYGSAVGGVCIFQDHRAADVGSKRATVQGESAAVLAIAYLDAFAGCSAVGYPYLCAIVADCHAAVGVNTPAVVASSDDGDVGRHLAAVDADVRVGFDGRCLSARDLYVVCPALDCQASVGIVFLVWVIPAKLGLDTIASDVPDIYSISV